jgi:hypothetical protein
MPANSPASTEALPRPRRWLQFRLRTLLIGVLLLSACLSGYVWLRERARRQAKAVATLREMGVYVIYESDASDTGEESMVPWRRWESGSDLLSRDFFENVVGVTAGEFDKNGPNSLPLADPRRFWNALRELPALKGVSVIDQVTPEDLRVLQNHSDLESLYIQTDPVSDEHLREIGRLEGLRDLIVEGDWVSRRQAQISHVGIDHLASLPHLRGLVLCNTTVDDRAALSLARLDKLEMLFLVATNLSDDGLAQLAGLKHLETINVSSSQVTKKGSDAFQAAMPNCEVQNFVPKK